MGVVDAGCGCCSDTSADQLVKVVVGRGHLRGEERHLEVGAFHDADHGTVEPRGLPRAGKAGDDGQAVVGDAEPGELVPGEPPAFLGMPVGDALFKRSVDVGRVDDGAG